MPNLRPREQFTWIGQVLRFGDSRPDDVALTFRDRHVTWSELAARVRKVASTLRERGVRTGDRVLIATFNSVEHIESVLGAQLAGAVAVPVNFRLAPGEVRYIAENCGASAVVVEGALAPLVRDFVTGHQAPCLVFGASAGGAVGEDYEAALAAAPAYDGPGPASMDDLAFVMYTSGTTGHPKGATLTYGNLISMAFYSIHAIKLVFDDEITLVTAPLFHTAGFGMLLPNLLLGYRAVILPTGNFSAEEFLDVAVRERVTNTWLLAAQWQLVCDSPTLKDRDLAFRRICWGAAPATEANLRSMEAAFPDAEIFCFFGQTEMSPNTTTLLGRDSLRRLGSVGRALPQVSVRVVDPEMNDVAVGEVGEIIYRAPSASPGYWNAPEATEAAWTGGWFHSGDLVRQDEEGFVYVVDRLKDMIISGGENVYCAEVENAIADHPKVLEVAVVGAPDVRWGETPVAFVVARTGDDPPTEEEIIEFARTRLASYKKPSRVHVLAELPRNSAGKIVKPALRAALG